MLLIYHLLRGTRFHSSQICWEFGWCGWMLEILGKLVRFENQPCSAGQLVGWLVGWFLWHLRKKYHLPGTLKNPFEMDVWWFPPTFSCNDSESSEWNNHLKLVVWSSRYDIYMPFCGWSKIIEWHAEQQQQNIQSSRLEVGTWLMKRFISISNWHLSYTEQSWTLFFVIISHISGRSRVRMTDFFISWIRLEGNHTPLCNSNG